MYYIIHTHHASIGCEDHLRRIDGTEHLAAKFIVFSVKSIVFSVKSIVFGVKSIVFGVKSIVFGVKSTTLVIFSKQSNLARATATVARLLTTSNLSDISLEMEL